MVLDEFHKQTSFSILNIKRRLKACMKDIRAKRQKGTPNESELWKNTNYLNQNNKMKM